MTSPYRTDVDVLAERKSALEQELARIKEQAAEAERLQGRQREIERELLDVGERLGAQKRRTLPMLENVRVASPCSASWDEMIGDERVRFCVSCEKNVYNLSAMSSEEAEKLLRERMQAELCVRFYQRADGTVMTSDCPVGVKRKRRKKLAVAAFGAGAIALTAMTRSTTCPTGSGFTQGAVAIPMPPPTDEPHHVMGELATPPVMGSAAPHDPPPPRPAVMGRRAPPRR